MKKNKQILELDLIPGKFIFYKGYKDYEFFELFNELYDPIQNIQGKCIRYNWINTVHIWVKDFKDYWLLAHEIMHWIYHIFRNINIDDEEMICYTLEYVLKHGYRTLKDY